MGLVIIGHRSSKSTFGAKCLLFTNVDFTRKNLFELFLFSQEMHLMSIQSLTTEWCKKMSKNASRKHQFVFKDNLPFSVLVTILSVAEVIAIRSLYIKTT